MQCVHSVQQTNGEWLRYRALPLSNSLKRFVFCVVGDGMEIVTCLRIAYFAVVFLPLTPSSLPYEGLICGRAVAGSEFTGVAGRCTGDTGRCTADAGCWYSADG